MSTDLTVTEAQTLQHPPSASRFAEEFDIYQAIQVAIDTRLQDHIMDIKGKKFRKKAYWRAVAVAFNLEVEPVLDELIIIKMGELGDSEYIRDWGYKVTYKATTSNGRSAHGDGACMKSEKLIYDYEWKGNRRGERIGINEEKTADNATHHNVRGHAHTRAYNRAVSNLVGFGEVSAEEMPRDSDAVSPQNPQDPVAKGSNQAPAASGAPWDGNLPVTFGKYKAGAKEGGENGKKWNEVPSAYLEWLLSNSDNDTIKDMAAKEVGRRAKAESSTAPPEDALPFDGPGPPPPEDDDRYGHGP